MLTLPPAIDSESSSGGFAPDPKKNHASDYFSSIFTLLGDWLEHMTIRNESPILILGASGMLATAWTRILRQLRIPFRAVSRQQINYCNDSELHNLLADNYSWIVNCAAFTNVDQAESKPREAYRANAGLPAMLGKYCCARSMKVLHYSTDYVFDGRSRTPYPIHNSTHPLNVYGQTKLQGERLLQASGCEAIIIRTSWLYAEYGNNFLRTMLKLMQERKELKVVADQYGRPTNAANLATISLKLLLANQVGVHHVADRGYCSWYGFAQAIQENSRLDCKINPCNTADFPRPARRPAYSVLDTSATESLCGPLPDWRHSVEKTIARIRRVSAPFNDRPIHSYSDFFQEQNS